MPGSIPPTSQLDWLSSTTAMIVLFWSRATRDLLKSFGWGIVALHRLDAATKLPPPRRPPHRIFRSLVCEIGEIRGEPGFSTSRTTARPCCHSPQSPAYLYAGGGTNPPISAASRRANSIVVGSSSSGPIICRPTGSPSSVNPISAAVAGRYDRLASPAKNNCSAYGADLPLTMTVRSSRLGLALCGNAAVAATGVSNTSKRLKNSRQAYRNLVRDSLALPQLRCRRVAPRATAARSL